MRGALRFTFWFVALEQAFVGVQATLAPHSFYTGFPFGRMWVQYLPPYNEHLISDVGGFSLAFAILFAWAGITLARPLYVPLTIAWSVAAIIHAVYHVVNLQDFPTSDAIVQSFGLFLVALLPILVIVISAKDVRQLPA